MVLLPVSCASDSADSTPEPHKTLSQRIDESNGYKQDADGNWKPKTDKRSPFESQGESAYFKGNVGKKDYKTGELSTKSWWGNKDYGSKQYSGNTSAAGIKKSSSIGDKGASETGKSAGVSNENYQTGAYATGSARESKTGNITKTTDDVTNRRRNAYPPPEIIDWREQRSLSVEQSKGILGR
jgi:hypothetical protein